MAQKIVILAQYFNNAMLCIERNNHGHSVINSVIHAERYDNLYYGEDGKAGWLTNARTKPMMITGSDGVVEAVHRGLMIVRDKEF